MNEEETKALKEKILSKRRERHKITQKEALARWSYEENVKINLFSFLMVKLGFLVNFFYYICR